MKVLNYIVFYLDRILRIIGNLILSTILIVITLGIISRYVFNAPFTWTEELTTFLMVNLGYISGTIVTIANKHVVADFLIAKAPPAFKKTMAILGKLISICVFLLIAVSAYQQFVTAPPTGRPPLDPALFYAPLMVMCSVMVCRWWIFSMRSSPAITSGIAAKKERRRCKKRCVWPKSRKNG